MTTANTARLRLTVPEVTGRLDAGASASVLARLIASGAASTKADLTRVTGLARSSVSTAVDALVAARVLQLAGTATRTGRGRPGDVLVLSEQFGCLMVADVGARTTRVGLSDLSQTMRTQQQLDLDVRLGPEQALRELTARLEGLLATSPTRGRPRVLVVGLPGPVDTAAGRPVRPPIMPGWDGYPVADELSRHFGCAVLVENDVNLRALGESRALPADQSPLLYIKVGTGIGAGIITADGGLLHGADGAAGDIGHVRTRSAPAVECACGATGCIEAVASAAAVLADLAQAPELAQAPPRSVEDVVDLLHRREPTTLRRIRDAATDLGEVVAMLVHVFNPARVVLGGTLAEASDDILAGLRGVVYASALPLATRNLVLARSLLGQDAGIAGALVLGLEHALSPVALTAS